MGYRLSDPTRRRLRFDGNDTPEVRRRALDEMHRKLENRVNKIKADRAAEQQAELENLKAIRATYTYGSDTYGNDNASSSTKATKARKKEEEIVQQLTALKTKSFKAISDFYKKNKARTILFFKKNSRVGHETVKDLLKSAKDFAIKDE